MNRRNRLYRDKITVVDKHGNRYEDVAAVVDKGKIYTRNVAVPIDIGDSIERKLSSGRIERLKAIDVFEHAGGITIPGFYEITYEREGARPHQSKPQPITVHISDSPQSHVNIDSEDHSISISYGNAGSLFDEIRDLLRETVEDSTELESLLEKVDAMEGSKEAGGFKQAYDDFIASAANHITVLLPILPALSSLLAQ